MINAQPHRIEPTRPPINDEMIKGAMRIALAIEELTNDGFVVIGIEYSTGCKPTIQVQACSRCQAMIDQGLAAYYRSGVGDRGHYRTGQFQRGNCRVLWTEQGH